MSTIKLKEQTSAPSTPSTDEKRIYVKADGLYTINDLGVSEKIGPTVGGTVNWGDIIGTLSSQTDLQSSLDAKITNPMTESGDMVVGTTAGAPIRLANNPTSSQLFLSSVNGVTSFQPIPAQGALLYYLTPTASDVGGAFKKLTTPYSPLTTQTSTSVGTGNVLLKTYITEPNNPNRTFIPAGEYSAHVHASYTGGTRSYQILVEIWEADASGVDIQILASCGPSTVLTTSNAEYIVAEANILKSFAGSTSRVKTKVYSVGTGGSAGDVNIHLGGTSDTRVTLPAPIIDATNFVPYIGATDNLNLGTFSLTAASASLPKLSNLSTNGWVKTSGGDGTLSVVDNLGAVGAAYDGAGVALLANTKVYVVCPYAGTISGWDMIADQVGSVVIDVWKNNNAVPTIAHTITDGAKPTLSTDQIEESTTLTGWTTAVVAGDVFAFNIDSVSTITKLTITLRIKKS
jgi:hypothetical protein